MCRGKIGQQAFCEKLLVLMKKSLRRKSLYNSLVIFFYLDLRKIIAILTKGSFILYVRKVFQKN